MNYLSQLVPSTHKEMDSFISLGRKVGKTKDGNSVREFYWHILVMILENTVHLFICGVGDAGKVLLPTRRCNNNYRIEDVSSSCEVLLSWHSEPRGCYLLFREGRYETADTENLGFKK